MSKKDFFFISVGISGIVFGLPFLMLALTKYGEWLIEVFK